MVERFDVVVVGGGHAAKVTGENGESS